MSAKCPNLLKLCAVEKNFRQVTFNFQSHQLFSGQKSIKTEETKWEQDWQTVGAKVVASLSPVLTVVPNLTGIHFLWEI